MLDLIDRHIRLPFVDREDRAMLRSNPSARSMPGDGQEHTLYDMLRPSRPSLGCRAINLLTWCEAPNKAETQQKWSTGRTYVSIRSPLLLLTGLWVIGQQVRNPGL